MVLPVRMIFNFIDTVGVTTNTEIYYDDHFEGAATEYEKTNPVSFGRSHNYVDQSHSSSGNNDGDDLVSRSNDEIGPNMNKLNYDNLINYAKKATLKDRVIEHYPNLRLIRKDSKALNTYLANNKFNNSSHYNNSSKRVLHRLNMINARVAQPKAVKKKVVLNKRNSTSLNDGPDEEHKNWKEHTFD
jgi:hypothetical protein